MLSTNAISLGLARIALLTGALCLSAPLCAAPPAVAKANTGGVPSAQTAQPVTTVALKPGEYRWMPELAPAGPVVVVVSLPEQLAHVYRNGVRIGVSTISSGKKGYETGPGAFPIIERETVHFSNLYDNAPMPFMLRLTMSGVALHAGKLPGYPASHGCIRLPHRFAESLFDTVRRGVIVVVANTKSHPLEVIAPGWVTPVDPATGAARDTADDTIAEVWAPERAREGPLSILLSTRDRRLMVLRNGIEIGHADATITGQTPPGTYAHALLVDEKDAEDAEDAEDGNDARRDKALIIAVATMMGEPLPPPTFRWQAVATPGKKAAAGAVPPPLRSGELLLTDTFARQLAGVLPADAILVITDEPLRMATRADRLPTVPALPPAGPRRDETPVTPVSPTPAQIPLRKR